jgi:hypothetical protein
MKPVNYYPSLEQRIKVAVSNNFDERKLDVLIAETERALDDAPDPARLQATLTRLKTTRAQSRLMAWVAL